MSTLRFDGVGAGLGEKSASGDRNHPVNYVLVCQCGVDLGPLARFIPLAGNVRCALCMLCNMVTVVEGAQIATVITKAEYERRVAAYRTLEAAPPPSSPPPKSPGI